ncbi:Hypothetical predicted protein [Mytilus galloprovincialis]|uniref:Endonuclease/exonuclease/phosphatase domain-containing protein n=1 Tax=Mytilus galloprovincialis TaxID=29158 RepID=A0A8B6CPG3_MYTGA|nr:Hypothetical predicted protein [Mytilus galloprovincialis]
MPDGYKYFAKHRTKLKKKSGGIIICFKSNLENFLKIPKSNSEFVQWVVLEKGLVDFDKNLLMGCMYLPPENTKYTSNEAFTEVEIEMIELVNKYNDQPLIVGDLNAKTKLLDDVVIPDDSLFDILDDFEDDSFVSYLYDYQNLCDSNVSLKRCSEDSSVPNKYGYKLIDFCKRNNLYIGNSRLPEDSSTDPKERINTPVDKICDLFKSTANRVFKPKGRFYPSGTSNQLWFNKQCRDKRKVFHKAKNCYSLNKNKENRDEMKKSGKVYRTEMSKSFESFQHALESDMRKLSKKDSGKFWKILKRFDRGGSDKDTQITIDQLYEYFKSLNKSDVPDDDIDFEDLANKLKNLQQLNLGNNYFHKVLDGRKLPESVIHLDLSVNKTDSFGRHRFVNSNTSGFRSSPEPTELHQNGFCGLRNITQALPKTDIKVLKANQIYCRYGFSTIPFIDDIKPCKDTNLMELYLDGKRLEMTEDLAPTYLPKSLRVLSLMGNRLR